MSRPRAFSRSRERLEVDIRRPEDGVHCRAEYRGLLDFRSVLERAHHVDRAARMNLEDRPLGEYFLQLAGRAHRGQLARIDDRDPVTVLCLVEVVGRHQIS